ncbi:hypothetical protein CR513_03642, partial [Mucuna pruriens]
MLIDYFTKWMEVEPVATISVEKVKTEAVIPVEIGEPSPQTALFQPDKNEEELQENLDLL